MRSQLKMTHLAQGEETSAAKIILEWTTGASGV
jgi:hypothetical protein